MLASKPNGRAGVSEASNGKSKSSHWGHAPALAPRVSRLIKASSGRSGSGNGGIVREASSSWDVVKPWASPREEGQPSKKAAAAASTADKQARAREVQLQSELKQVREELKDAREQLASTAHSKTRADEASRRLEEAVEVERFKSMEREQSAIDLLHSKELEYDALRTRHAQDVASLISATRELDGVKHQLAAAALSHARETKQLADGNAAEVARLKSELEKKARDASEITGKLQSQASELHKANAALEEQMRLDIARAKQSAEEWKAKAAALEARLLHLSQSSEDSLAAMAKRCEGKVASLQSEAGQYKEELVETSRRLGMAREEASRLQAAADRLRSEHQQLAVLLSQDKARLVQELGATTREEREKAKAAVEDLAAAQAQIAELRAAVTKQQLMLDESKHEAACLSKTVERLGSEARSSKDEWASKEAGLVGMLKRSEEGASRIRSDMGGLVASLGAAEKRAQELKEENAQLHSKLRVYRESSRSGSDSETAAMVGGNEEKVAALKRQVRDLRLGEAAALAKADEVSKLLALAEAAARREQEEAGRSSRTLEARVRALESSITEASLSAEEEKMSSIRLRETLADKERELLTIALENDSLRAREAAAQRKIHDLPTKAPERQPNLLLKMMCSPMDDQPRANSGRIVQVEEEIKHVKVETVKHHRSAADDDDLSKEIRGNATDVSSDDDAESQGGDALLDQMDGMLIYGPTSSFNQEQEHEHSHKKKKAILKKFGSMLKKKAQFTKLRNHS